MIKIKPLFIQNQIYHLLIDNTNINLKMSKKIVNSNCPEFGYELLSSVPYAYNLFLKGELEETISGFDTSGLYFFSPKHTESNLSLIHI